MCGCSSPADSKGNKETMVGPDASSPSPSPAKPGTLTNGKDDNQDDESSLAKNYVPDRDMTKTPPPFLSGKRKRSGKRGKIGKKPADMPRRPLSGYNYFFSEQKTRILEEQAQKKDSKQDIFTTLGRIVADRWKKLNDKDKEKYNELAAKDLIRYRQEMEKYNEKIAMRNRKEAELKKSGEDPDDDSSSRQRSAMAGASSSGDQLGGSFPGERLPSIPVQMIPQQAQSISALYGSPLLGAPGLLNPMLSLTGGLHPLLSQTMDLGRLALDQHHQILAARLDPTLLARADLHQLLGHLPPTMDAAAQLSLLHPSSLTLMQQPALRFPLDPNNIMASSRDAALLQSLNVAVPSATGGTASLVNKPASLSLATPSSASSTSGGSGGGGEPDSVRQAYVRLLQRQQDEEEVLRQLRQRGWGQGGRF